jgi:hypothetical protein
MKTKYNENRVINNSFVNLYWEDEKHITDVINDKYGTNYAPENLVVVKSSYTNKGFGDLEVNNFGICTYLNAKKSSPSFDGVTMQDHTLGNINPFIFQTWSGVIEIYYLHIRYV